MTCWFSHGLAFHHQACVGFFHGVLFFHGSQTWGSRSNFITWPRMCRVPRSWAAQSGIATAAKGRVLWEAFITESSSKDASTEAASDDFDIQLQMGNTMSETTNESRVRRNPKHLIESLRLSSEGQSGIYSNFKFFVTIFKTPTNLRPLLAPFGLLSLSIWV